VSALEIGDDVCVINSFSKYFSMTGWRVGWLVLPEAQVRQVERLAQNLFICPPHAAQIAALAALDAREETEANLEKLRTKPCLLPWGLRDFCFDEVFLEEWSRRFPEAEVVRLDEAGHYVFEDGGADLRERIADFARRVFSLSMGRTEP